MELIGDLKKQTNENTLRQCGNNGGNFLPDLSFYGKK
jgi:hypothetical protein